MLPLTLTAVVALAQNPHFQGDEPECTINEMTNTVSCTSAVIAGVGNVDASVELIVNASATLLCHILETTTLSSPTPLTSQTQIVRTILR